MENNYEMITKMKPYQLAQFLNDLPKKQYHMFCNEKNCDNYATCRACIHEWLQRQADRNHIHLFIYIEEKRKAPDGKSARGSAIGQ